MLYFAYGANLNKRGMAMRCHAARPLGLAVLKNYRLCFKRYADIIQSEGHEVHGALWEITPACVRALDGYEGGDYRQVAVTVEANGVATPAIAYAMHGANAFAPPEMDYYREIAVGYRDWGLDEQLLRRARYDTLNVGAAGLKNTPAPSEKTATPQAPRRRALWDPATQSSGMLDHLIPGPRMPGQRALSGVKRKPRGPS